MDAGYALAFTTGLIGGFGHCIGMCGPLVAAWTLREVKAPPPAFVKGGEVSPAATLTAAQSMLPQLLYNSGRITTYALVGAAMGYAGSFVNVAARLAGFQNGAMALAGAVMLIMGAGIMGLTRGAASLERHNAALLRRAQALRAFSSPLKYYPLGALLGLLPCGLSYTAFIAAAGAGSPVSGMLTTLAFGLGTAPALFGFGVAASYLGSRLRGRVQQAGGAAVIVMGLYYIVKGIRLYAQM